MSDCRFLAANGPQASMQVSGPTAEDDQRCVSANLAYRASELLSLVEKVHNFCVNNEAVYRAIIRAAAPDLIDEMSDAIIETCEVAKGGSL